MLMTAVLPRDTVVTYKPPRGAKVNLSTTNHVALADTGYLYPLKGDLGPEDERPQTLPTRGRLKSPLIPNGAVIGLRSSHNALPELSHSYGSLSNLNHGSNNGSVSHLARTSLKKINTLRSSSGSATPDSPPMTPSPASPVWAPHPPSPSKAKHPPSPPKVAHPASPSNPIHPASPSNAFHPASPFNTFHPASPFNTFHPTSPFNAFHPASISRTAHPASTSNTAHPAILSKTAHPPIPSKTAHPPSPSKTAHPPSPSKTAHASNLSKSHFSANSCGPPRPVSLTRQHRLGSRNNSSSTETNDSCLSSIFSTNTEEVSIAIPFEENEDNDEPINLRDEVVKWSLRNSIDEEEEDSDLEERNLRTEVEERVMRNHSRTHTDWARRSLRADMDKPKPKNPRTVMLKSNSLTFTPMMVSQQPPQRDQHGCSRPIMPTCVNLQQRHSGISSRRANFRSNKTVSFDCDTRTEIYEADVAESETDETEYVRLMNHYDRRPFLHLPVTHVEEYLPPGKKEQDFLPKMLCFALALVMTGGILYGLNIIISHMNMNLFSS